VRPRSGPQIYRLQVFREGRWQWVSPAATTEPNGTFVRTVSAARGARLRVWSPADRSFGAPLAIQ
jgi:hypothetical protein